MRISARSWLAPLFGIAVVSNLVGFGVVGSVSAQSASASTPAATSAATMSEVIYPPCIYRSAVASTIVSVSATPTTVGATAAPGIVPTSGPAYLGITAYSVQNCGVRVSSLLFAGPAANSDLLVGDIIVAVDNTAVSTIADSAMPTPNASGAAPVDNYFSPVTFFKYIATTYTPGQTVILTVQRKDLQMKIPITLGVSRPVGSATSAAK